MVGSLRKTGQNKIKNGPGFLRLDQKTKIYKRRLKLLYYLVQAQKIAPTTATPTDTVIPPIKKLF